MLTLFDAFSIGEPESLDGENFTLIDHNFAHTKFTPRQLAFTVRSISGGIWRAFRDVLDRGDTLSCENREVALILEDGAASVLTMIAVTALSKVACPMLHTLAVHEYEQAFEELEIDLVITNTKHTNAVRAAEKLNIPLAHFEWKDAATPSLTVIESTRTVPVDMSDPVEYKWAVREYEECLYVHTAGRTARPSLVRLTQRNVCLTLANIQKTYAWVGYGRGDDGTFSGRASGEEMLRDSRRSSGQSAVSGVDVGLCVNSTSRLHGLIVSCLAPLSCSSLVVIPKRPVWQDSNAFWEMVDKHKVTYSSITAPMLDALVKAGPDERSASLRFLRVTQAAVKASTLTKAQQMFDAYILEAYGISEACHHVASNGLPTFSDLVPSSVGKPAGIEVCILDTQNPRIPKKYGEVGDVYIRGYTVKSPTADDLVISHNAIKWEDQSAFYSSIYDLHHEGIAPRVLDTSTPFIMSPRVQLMSTTNAVSPRRISTMPSNATTTSPRRELTSPSVAGLTPGSGSSCPSPRLPIAHPPTFETTSAMEISEVSTPAPTYDLSGPTTVQSVSPAPIADFLEGKDGAVPRLLRPSVLRFASALDVYVTFDFPERFEPHTTPLQPQLLWMSTNDKGYLSAEGILFIKGRSDTVFNKNGIRLSLLAVSDVYGDMDGVEEAVAFGVVNAEGSDELYVAVRTQLVLDDALRGQWREAALNLLAEFKLPDKVIAVDEFPRDDKGNVDRSELARLYGP